MSGSVGAPLREVKESRLKALKMLRTIWAPEGRVAWLGTPGGMMGREVEGRVAYAGIGSLM